MKSKIKFLVITIASIVLFNSCIFIPIGGYGGEGEYGYNNVYYVAETIKSDFDTYIAKNSYELQPINNTGFRFAECSKLETFQSNLYNPKGSKKYFTKYQFNDYVLKYRNDEQTVEDMYTYLNKPGNHVIFFMSNIENSEKVYCISK